MRLELDRLPLAEGRFRVRLELGSPDGRRLYHWLDDAARFFAYAGERARGPVLLDGRWSLQEIGARETIGESR